MVAFFNFKNFLLKSYNKTNFFKHTFCQFEQVSQMHINQNKMHYKSKAGSKYFYTEEGVYRYSNHWGRVANCRWRLLSSEKIKSQNYHLGFAKWTDFYPLKETEKQFYILVDYHLKTVNFYHKETNPEAFLFFASTAQKKVKKIKQLLVEESWAKYFELPIDELREKIITEYINSNISLQEIKRLYKYK